MKILSTALLVLAFVVLQLLSGCNSEKSMWPLGTDEKSVTAIKEITAFVPPGNMQDADSVRLFAASGEPIRKENLLTIGTRGFVMDTAKSLSFTLDVVQQSFTNPKAPPSTQADIKGQIGKYFVRLSGETHFLPGCIKLVVPHIGLTVRDIQKNSQEINLHLAGWKQDGRVCFAIYNSASGWCKKICSPDWGQIKGGITEALIAAGVSTAVAYAIATFVTPVIVPILAL
jgi:hypothetical protein